MDELDLRRHVYRTLADTGLAPTADEIAELVGGPEAAAEHLQRLEDRHFVVLGPDGEINMALPFAARTYRASRSTARDVGGPTAHGTPWRSRCARH